MPTKLQLREFDLRAAHRLRDLREAAGMTQDQVAEFLDLHVTNVGRMEHGKAGISMGQLYYLCVKWNIPFESILPDREGNVLPNLKRFSQKQTLQLFKQLNELPPHLQDFVVAQVEHTVNNLRKLV